jgi:predicted TIM-barrel fold metal-dependent hydrolase
VFTCTQSGSGGYRYTRFNEPVHVGDMLCEFPDMTVVMLHAGYPLKHWFEEALNVAAGNINAYIEIDFWLYGMGYTARDPAQAWVPNIVNDEETIVRMLAQAKATIGAHKILFGSDSHQGPSFNGPQSVWHFGWHNLLDWWKRLPETAAKYGYQFTSEEVDLILGGNAARILGIERPPEWEVKHKYGWGRRYPSPNRAR